MQQRYDYKIFLILLIFFTFSSFFLGFYLDENSAGAGAYDEQGFVGDFDYNWANIQLFLNHDLISAIKHPDYFTNRPPLMYILHALFNPFLETPAEYRRSVFIISLAGPVLFYFCLKQKFQKQDSLLLLLISSTICLSPYYRTTAFWGLEENYSIIGLLLSFLFLNYFLNNKDEYGYKSYTQLFLTILFSASCVYFDQKFVIVPIICFLTVIFSNKLTKFKIFSSVFYFLSSLPFIYLIILWGGIVSPSTADFNPYPTTTIPRLGNIYPIHIGYASTIISLYLLPFLLFKQKNLHTLVKDFFLNKKNYYLISLFFIYLFYLINSFDFSSITEKYWLSVAPIGLGYVPKISSFLFEGSLQREIFTYFAFFVSWIVILIYFDRNIKDILILFYFFFVAIHVWPVMQEYFDPFVLLMTFTFFNSKLFINYKNSIILFLYFAIFLISANTYYSYFAPTFS